MPCDCGDPRPFEKCCGPYLTGAALPPTAEALMRSRYTAYARGEVDYIFATQAPEGRATLDRAQTEAWSKQSTWRGLEIVRTERGGPDDRDGVVEFVAHFDLRGEHVDHHELATFRRDDRWYFVDGKEPKLVPFQRRERKVGPNEPCPCGSGKKFKKCCG